MKKTSFLTLRAVATPARVLALLGLLGSPVVHAQLTLDATVTAIPGSFLYDITITNNDPDEYLIVSFTDAPLGDPLIAPSLTSPAGFLSSYDDGLGFVDFLADSASFLPGGTVGGFMFESLADPRTFFTQFEAQSFNGTVTGLVKTALVPEPGTVAAGGAVALLLAGAAIRRRSRRS